LQTTRNPSCAQVRIASPKEEAEPPQAEAAEFARQAEAAEPGLLRDFWDFLCQNKKWWLTPIVLVLLLLTLLVAVAGTGAWPIYTLF
jgi:hypothetical protein